MEKRLQRRWRGRKTRRVWHRESWVKCFKRESWSCGQENYEYTDSIVCSFIVYISTLVILMISLSVEGCGRSHNVVAKDWAGSQNLPQGGMATVQGGLRIWARFLRQLYVCVCICLCLLCCFVTFLLKGAILNYSTLLSQVPFISVVPDLNSLWNHFLCSSVAWTCPMATPSMPIS